MLIQWTLINVDVESREGTNLNRLAKIFLAAFGFPPAWRLLKENKLQNKCSVSSYQFLSFMIHQVIRSVSLANSERPMSKKPSDFQLRLGQLQFSLLRSQSLDPRGNAVTTSCFSLSWSTSIPRGFCNNLGQKPTNGYKWLGEKTRTFRNFSYSPIMSNHLELAAPNRDSFWFPGRFDSHA